MIASSRLQSLMPAGMIALCAVMGLVSTWVGLQQPLIGIGIAYVLAFMTLAWFKPEIALMLCFASAPIQNDLSGDANTEGRGKFSISEIHVCLTFLVLLLKQIQARKLITLGPVTIPMLLHFAVCIFSSVQSYRSNTIVSMIQMILYWVVTFSLFAWLPKPGESFKKAMVGLILVGSVLASASLVTRQTYILGLHKNGVGSSIACALVVAIELWYSNKGIRYRWLLVFAIALLASGLLNTLSRGSWLLAGVALITMSMVRRDYKLLLRLALILIPVISIGWFMLPKESREYATGFDKGRENISARFRSIEYAKEKFYGSPIYGQGVGLRKEFDATNIVFSTLAETGIAGMCTLIAIHATFVIAMSRTQMQISKFSPLYSLPALGAGLLMGKLCNGLVDHYWSRGALAMAWMAAGMGLSAYFYVRAMRKWQPHGEII